MNKEDRFEGRYRYYAYSRKNIKNIFIKGMLLEHKDPDYFGWWTLL